MADYKYINQTGVIVPDTSTLLTDVQNEYLAVFGTDLVTTPNTPGGLLIAAETLARANVLANNSQMANQINPNQSGGIFLDALLALLGSSRIAQTYTTVTANLTGVPGASIPAGSQAQNSVTLDIYTLQSTVVLNGSGLGTGIFKAVNPGPLAVAIGNLTIIVTGIVGWETITNPAAGTPGTYTQSDTQAKNFRLQTLAVQSSSLAEAIITALYLKAGATSVAFQENTFSTTQVINGVTMPPKSIYACVAGGSPTDIANALVSKKSGGCAYSNGAGTPISVSLTVPFSGQVMNILFDRPTQIGILVRATVKSNPSIQDPVNTVKKAIKDYVNGNLLGEPGFVIGESVSAFELAGAVNIEAPTIFVQNMEISLVSPIDYSNTTIPIEIFQQAFTNDSFISVVLI